MTAPIGQIHAAEERPEEVERDIAAARRSRMPLWLAILWANRKSRVGLLILAGFTLVAVFAPLIAPHDPRETSFEASLPPSRTHLLGTTAAGQDIFSQLVYGARTSIIVGLVAGALVTVIGLLVGLTAGYLQGWVDEVLSFVINLALVVPVLPLMVTLAAYAPDGVRGLWLIIFVISVTGWAWGARVKRAQILTLRARDYITAARFAGEGTMRIIFKEIMPNMLSLVVAGFLGAAGGAIAAEAGLEFLGLGDPTTVSWGTMLYWANNSGAMLTGQWLWLGAPGLAIALLLSSLTLINFGVDALSNPHLREG
ncbi:ABC transporter permease [Thermasporomyces composti]|uniref:Peptide/nickel transport system permease protein n=1 Tax=Thermasporomyces composti TaxID=696763 RepID=A0A3D9VBN9_THECX|nr:ABC transporter permease [Thermasporomyces composti]REF37600.1 peptide/nickel transport system permease protein [Thermasporomyces composti]